MGATTVRRGNFVGQKVFGRTVYMYLWLRTPASCFLSYSRNTTPNEKKKAVEHLDFCIKEFREMKMQPSLERELRHKEILKA